MATRAAKMMTTPAWTLNRGLRWSLICHLGLVVAIIVKSLIFPNDVKPFIPSLRVDLVGLPDSLKKDLERAKTLPLPKLGETDPVEAVKPAQKIKEALEKFADPDELVLNPKKDKLGKKAKKEEETTLKDRTKNALTRIKALARINDAEESTANESAVVKGNIASKGAALTGNAKESAQQSYYESVLTRLQANWSLPVWLTRQSLQAQVQILIDHAGRVKVFHFVKSSGNTQFDNAVKKAIASSEPFQVPPVELRGSLLSHGILLGFPL